MWRQLLFVLPLILTSNGIKVPVDRSEEAEADETPNKEEPTQITPTYYVTDDENIDSYLIPPSPHKPEALPDGIATPATYLLPPTQEKHDYYYNPTEPGEQSDWYPIAQTDPAQRPQLQAIPIYQNLNYSELIPIKEQTRRGKSHDRIVVPVPATDLEPPLEDAHNEYFASNPSEFPLEEIQRPITVPKVARYELPSFVPNKQLPLNYRPKPTDPLALHLIPPQPEKYKIPTKLYPKKFGGEFNPVPIPIAQYVDDSASEIPRAKPAKLLKPLPSIEIDYLPPTDEKINYLYRKAEHKRKLKDEGLSQDQPLPEVAVEDTYSKYNGPVVTEQKASETSLRYPERNVYSAPLRQAPPPAPQRQSEAPAPDERTEFRMHGMKGPHSYQFGFDTGKGKNRQFRYEERDNEGQVRGHYGYMDKHGKLRVVNYSADPKTGFHAEAPVDKE